MKILDLIQRKKMPDPWSEGEKIPWNDPDFSQRMLLEHLSQQHDAASRRSEIIEKQVAWIHANILSGRPARILDLGCGPGLYTSRFARLGHCCVGIDFSPASIMYAAEHDRVDDPGCTYIQQDIRTADYGQGYQLVMLIFGEFNTFRPADARTILEKAHQALAPGGCLLLEAHTFAAVRAMGEACSTWYSSASGLFSDRPHMCLMENFWDKQRRTATERYFILDAASGSITRYAESLQAYDDEQYRELLEDCGFEDVYFFPSLTGGVDEAQSAFTVITGQKR